jgi:hypothetical protein
MVYCMQFLLNVPEIDVTLLSFGNLLKGLKSLLGLWQKGICYPFDQFTCGIRESHGTPLMFAIPLGELKLNKFL